MPVPRISLVIAALLAALWLGGGAAAQSEDVFAFMPQGGRTLLAQALQGKPAEEAKAILSATRTRAEWVTYLRGRTAALPALKGLDDTALQTLAAYLAANMPLPATALPADPAKADWAKLLPPDGRDFALNYCQSCHIITVVVTQDRSREAWLGTLHKPSHIGIKLTQAQREALVDYLLLNAAIPIDQVPPELRAGGATY